MHAAILGVAMSLLGVKVGWEVDADRSVVYVIQLDAGDMDRFRIDGVIESDIPPQVKNVRRVRIELATLLALPPVQELLPKEESLARPPSPSPSTPPSPEPSKRQGQRSFGAQTKTSGPATSDLPGFLVRRTRKRRPKGRREQRPRRATPRRTQASRGRSRRPRAPRCRGHGCRLAWPCAARWGRTSISSGCGWRPAVATADSCSGSAAGGNDQGPMTKVRRPKP